MTTPPKLPTFMYGTAWKEDRTEALTRLAITEGFRAIDTANQRKHYFEAGVGAATELVGWQSVRPVAQNCRCHRSLPSALA